MKTVQICDLFDVGYGTKFDLNKMTAVSRKDGGVSFVGRSGRNNGVTAEVAPVTDVSPLPAGSITIALGGSSLLSAFVQPAPFYTAQNVGVLIPRIPMTLYQKLFACQAIAANKVRYSAFGREANRTFRTLEIPHPDEAPHWVERDAHNSYSTSRRPHTVSSNKVGHPERMSRHFMGDIFDIKRGRGLTKAKMTPGKTPFVSATAFNNGVSAYIGQDPIHPGGTITVANGGSVGEAYYQPLPYWPSAHVNVLYPRFNMCPEVGLYIATIIRQEKYRFNFGRAWHLDRMRETTISLPTRINGDIDLNGIAAFMRQLPFSSVIASVLEA